MPQNEQKSDGSATFKGLLPGEEKLSMFRSSNRRVMNSGYTDILISE